MYQTLNIILICAAMADDMLIEQLTKVKGIGACAYCMPQCVVDTVVATATTCSLMC